MIHANLTLGPWGALLVIIALDVSKLVADHFLRLVSPLASELAPPTCTLFSTRWLRPNSK